MTVCWWIGCQSVCSSSQTITVSGGGERLRVQIAETFGPDEAGSHMLEFYFDAELGCYGVELQADLALLNPREVEVSNLYAAGMGQAWPERAKLQHTLWSNPRDGLTFFRHNPLVPNTPGNLERPGQRSVPPGGFLCFGTRPEFNPALEILHCHTPAISFATCSCSYDEHFLLGCPAPLDADGQYRWAVRYRLVSLPPEFSKHLLAKARLLDFGIADNPYHSARYLDHLRGAARQVQPLESSLPFVPGKVNDCETALDPAAFLSGHYWVFAPQAFGSVTWDQTVGYQSRASLKLTGRTPAAKITGNTCGPSIMIFDRKAFTFSAMVKTKLAPGARAWIQIESCTFAPGDCQPVFPSAELTGTADWTKLVTHANLPPAAAFILVTLRLEGAGDAWFDDLALQPADSRSATSRKHA